MEKQEEAVDLSRLDQMMEGDETARNEFCRIYIKQAEETLVDLRESLTHQDNVRWKKAAHKLKGSSQTFGASGLSALCYEAEQGNEAPPEEKEKQLAAITEALAQVKACVRDMIAS